MPLQFPYSDDLCTKLPYPLANVYTKFRSEQDSSSIPHRAELVTKLYVAALHFLTFFGISAYLHEQPETNESLALFRRLREELSDGTLCKMLKFVCLNCSASNFGIGAAANGKILAPMAQGLLQPCGDGCRIRQAMRDIPDLVHERFMARSRPDCLSFMDFLVEFHNKRRHHFLDFQSEGVRRRVYNALEPAMQQLYETMRFLFPWSPAVPVRDAESGWFDILRGFVKTRCRLDFVPPVTAPPRTVQLALMGTDGPVSLHGTMAPFFEWQTCGHCHVDSLFHLAGVQEDKLCYRSMHCGHSLRLHSNDARYIDRLSAILILRDQQLQKEYGAVSDESKSVPERDTEANTKLLASRKSSNVAWIRAIRPIYRPFGLLSASDLSLYLPKPADIATVGTRLKIKPPAIVMFYAITIDRRILTIGDLGARQLDDGSDVKNGDAWVIRLRFNLPVNFMLLWFTAAGQAYCLFPGLSSQRPAFTLNDENEHEFPARTNSFVVNGCPGEEWVYLIASGSSLDPVARILRSHLEGASCRRELDKILHPAKCEALSPKGSAGLGKPSSATVERIVYGDREQLIVRRIRFNHISD